MSDYQAVHDGTAQAMGRINLAGIVGEQIERAFSHAGHVASMAAQEALNVANDAGRPSVLYRPRIFVDGGQWCALYGENVQDGVAGFGDSPDLAMRAFDAAWVAVLPKAKEPTP